MCQSELAMGTLTSIVLKNNVGWMKWLKEFPALKSLLQAVEFQGVVQRRSLNVLGEKDRRFELSLKRSSFDPEEFSLYRRYQIKVHNDTPDHVTESSYKRFLVDSPLIHVPSTGNGTVPPCGFGSFHQQYLIDGRLFAVGIIDILPECLSSKYLFWDPDHAFLSLGKYSSLREIAYVQENQLDVVASSIFISGVSFTPAKRDVKQPIARLSFSVLFVTSKFLSALYNLLGQLNLLRHKIYGYSMNCLPAL